jgi:hypothetical protein
MTQLPRGSQAEPDSDLPELEPLTEFIRQTLKEGVLPLEIGTHPTPAPSVPDLTALPKPAQLTPESILVSLATHQDAKVRQPALKRLHAFDASPAALNSLANCGYDDAQLAAAGHPAFSQDGLLELTRRSTFVTVRGAALNRLLKDHLSTEALTYLAASTFEDVLLAVLDLPHFPLNVLADLGADSRYESVRGRALTRLLASGPSPLQLQRLARSAHQEIAQAVAGHSQAPMEVLLTLALTSAHPQVRKPALDRILQNPLDQVLLSRLAECRYEEAQQAAAAQQQTSRAVLVRLAGYSQYAGVRKAALDQLIQASPSAETLSQLADSTFSEVILVVARHSNTPSACYSVVGKRLGAVLQTREFTLEIHTTQRITVDDTEYDNYGSVTSSGSHEEDREVITYQPDYEKINRLLQEIPAGLRAATRPQAGSLAADPKIHWEGQG